MIFICQRGAQILVLNFLISLPFFVLGSLLLFQILEIGSPPAAELHHLKLMSILNLSLLFNVIYRHHSQTLKFGLPQNFFESFISPWCRTISLFASIPVLLILQAGAKLTCTCTFNHSWNLCDNFGLTCSTIFEATFRTPFTIFKHSILLLLIDWLNYLAKLLVCNRSVICSFILTLFFY